LPVSFPVQIIYRIVSYRIVRWWSRHRTSTGIEPRTCGGDDDDANVIFSALYGRPI